MTTLCFVALATEEARHFQKGGKDCHDQVPITIPSSGAGAPCRHCLEEIAAGDDILLFSYRPFPKNQAFAERGPIFIHKKPCKRAMETDELPQIFKARDTVMVRGYDAQDQIVYKDGGVVAMENLKQACRAIFQHPEVAYIHARSALYGCYQCRIERAS